MRGITAEQTTDTGVKSGFTSDQSKRMKALERENRELKRANEILKKAAAFFRPGGARPQTQVRVDFIDPHRDEHGVEPICKELPIAMKLCPRKSNASGMRITVCMVLTKSGSSLTGNRFRQRVVPWSA